MNFIRIFLAFLRSLPKAQRREVGEAIAMIQEAFGQSHRHRGIGVRKLARDYYEARIGLQKRLVFEHKKNALFFRVLGTQDEVKAFLKFHLVLAGGVCGIGILRFIFESSFWRFLREFLGNRVWGSFFYSHPFLKKSLYAAGGRTH